MLTPTHRCPNRAVQLAGQLLIGLFSLMAVPVSAQIDWTPRSQGFNLNAITHTNSRFVGVGAGASNTVAISADGISWQKGLIGTGEQLNGVFALTFSVVAVGNNGRIMFSPDEGNSWAGQTSGTANDLQDVTYGGSVFVAVGEGGTILTSPNGLSWTARTSGTTNDLLGVSYGDGQFTAVGELGTLLTSTNGTTWTARSSGTIEDLRDVAYGNGRYVAVGGWLNNNVTLTSTNGVTWTGQSFTSSANQPLNGITFGSGQFVSVGRNGLILTSPDGTTWANRNLVLVTDLQDVAYAGGRFVTVGRVIRTSTDAINWQQTDAPDNASRLVGVAYGNGRYVAVGNSFVGTTSGTVLTSTSGFTFTRTDHGNYGGISGLAFAQGLFVAVGENITTSPDGLTWTLRSSNAATGQLGEITYGNGRFVAVGSNGRAAVSTDGLNWTATSMGTTTESFLDVTYGNGLFVAVGPPGVVRTSPDGITWTARTVFSQNNAYLSGVAYGNGTFVAVGYQGGSIRRSVDGINWTGTVNSSGANYGHITFGNGLFVIVNESGNISTTPDGLNPVGRNSNFSGELLAVRFVNGQFMAVGADATIVSAPAIPQYINQPPVAPVIPNQTATVGTGFFQNTPSFTDPNSSVQIISVQAFNLPPGLSYSGGASGIVAGNPTTAGVYSVSLVATDSPNESITGGLSATAVYTITVNPAGTPVGTFAISGVTLLDCIVFTPGGPNKPEQRALLFAPAYTGTFTPPMSFSVVSLLPLTTNPDARIYPSVDAPTVTIFARDAVGRTATYLWNWAAQCGGINLPPVAPAIANQTATVGMPFFQNTPQFTDPNSSQIVGVQAFGLPPGLSYSGTASGIVAGTPTAAGVYSVSLVGTDFGNPSLTGGLSATAVYTITVNPAGTPVGTFTIGGVTLLSCNVLTAAGPNNPEQRAVLFAPAYSGTFTPPMSFSVVSLLPLTGNADAYIYPSADAPTVTIFARDAVGRTATYVWNWLAQCGIAPSPNPFAIGSVAVNNCTVLSPASGNGPAQWQVTYTPQLTGTYTLPVTQSVVAAMLPTTSAGPFTLKISADAPQLTLVAVDATGKAAPNFTWNWLQACTNGARRSAEDAGQLRVVVLGNPTRGESVEVEIGGAAGASVELEMTTAQGVRVDQQRIRPAGATERHWVKLGRSAGLYVLRVRTATQVQTVKVLKH